MAEDEKHSATSALHVTRCEAFALGRRSAARVPTGADTELDLDRPRLVPSIVDISRGRAAATAPPEKQPTWHGMSFAFTWILLQDTNDMCFVRIFVNWSLANTYFFDQY